MYKPIQLKKMTTPSVKNSISPSPFRLAFLLIPLAVACFALFPTAEAGSATWLASPVNGDWNTATNWTADGPPNGPSDMAFFATSNTTAVSLSANTEVNATVFNAAGSAFTITASPSFTLTISGAGMTNNSGTTQNFVADIDGIGNFGTIAFTNSATAGSLTAFTANGSTLRAHPAALYNSPTPRPQAMAPSPSTAARAPWMRAAQRRHDAVLRHLNRGQWHLHPQRRHDRLLSRKPIRGLAGILR